MTADGGEKPAEERLDQEMFIFAKDPHAVSDV